MNIAKPAQKKLNVSIETINREIAPKMLERNTRNYRPKDLIRIGKYARDMEMNAWRFSNDAICFDCNDNLINGQHRLEAIVLSGYEGDFLIVRGMAEDADQVMDMGKPRNIGDALRKLGFTYFDLKAAVARLYFIHKNFGLNALSNPRAQGTPDEITKLAIALSEDIEHSNAATQAVQPYLVQSVAVLGHKLFSEQNPEMADQFFLDIGTGANLPVGSPALAFRNMLIEQKGSKLKRCKRDIIALMFKAWNYYKIGKKIEYLKLNSNGAKKEKFPTI